MTSEQSLEGSEGTSSVTIQGKSIVDRGQKVPRGGGRNSQEHQKQHDWPGVSKGNGRGGGELGRMQVVHGDRP